MATNPSKATMTPPRHIAVIMDGNGRWAKKRMLPRVEGHRRGADAVRKCIAACMDAQVEYLTLYAFSSENWNRPADEVADLMNLLKLYLRKEVAELHKKNVQIRFIGSRERLAPDTLELMTNAEALTSSNDQMQVNIALNYGAQAEIAHAARLLAQQVANGALSADQINEERLNDCLLTHGIPDPELIIRTSGEKRLSNFMLWQAAYSELIFLDVLWPDFNADSLNDAIHEYYQRDRRFGGR